MTDLSVIVPVRDMEREVAGTIRCAADLGCQVHTGGLEASSLATEILAVDQRSGDNTLSVLSVLHDQIHGLRTLPGVPPGGALRAASRVVRGRVWVVLDRPVPKDMAGWAISEVVGGKRAALVPGELLVVDRWLGAETFGRLGGGLVAAQNAVARHLRRRDEPVAIGSPAQRDPSHRVGLWLRGGLSKIGLGRFDRPGGW